MCWNDTRNTQRVNKKLEEIAILEKLPRPTLKRYEVTYLIIYQIEII